VPLNGAVAEFPLVCLAPARSGSSLFRLGPKVVQTPKTKRIQSSKIAYRSGTRNGKHMTLDASRMHPDFRVEQP